jgi:hypothetical protein
VTATNPQGDPISRAKRRDIAARRIGIGNACECGENRPFALIAQSNPMICKECMQRKKGHRTIDLHHPPGRANDSTTLPIGANDHAALSEAQRAWPEQTLENPDGSPLLAIASRIRSHSDLVEYLTQNPLLRSAPFVEDLDAILTAQFGRKWWTKQSFRKLIKRRPNQ